MKFSKMQGAGNDFVVLETSDTQRDWSSLAVAMCDRHYGIGADGLLLLLPSTIADFRMRIFNADGSESDVCGNGLRCLVKYFVDMGLAKPGSTDIMVETGAGIRKARIRRTQDILTEIQVGMGEPKLAAEDIPVVLAEGKVNVLDITPLITCSIAVDGTTLPFNLVSMGNPHAVFFSSKSPTEFPLAKLGPKVERHVIFPKATNFEVVRVISRKEIEARVWERGVGETLACGSGACAIAVAARLLDYTDDKVDIKLPGGTLQVEWDGEGEIFLSGPAKTVFIGEWIETSRSSVE